MTSVVFPMGKAIRFGVWLGSKDSGEGGPMDWEPAQATVGAAAAAEVIVAEAAWSPQRDIADGAAANTVAGASGRSRNFERETSADGTRIEMPQVPREYGGRAVPLP